MRQLTVKTVEPRYALTKIAVPAALTVRTAIALSTALLALAGSAHLAAAQATGTGTGGNAGGGQTGAPAAGAPGTAAPGQNAPGTGAPTATGAGTVGPTAAPVGSGVGTGMAAQDGGVSSDAGSTGTGAVAPGANGGSLPGTNRAPDSPNFDLARTIQGAITSSASLTEAQTNLEIDRRRVKEVRDQENPTLTADGSATRFDQATQVALMGAKFTVIGEHTEALSISAADRLDLFGIIRAQTNQANLQTLADSFTVTSIQNERVLQAQTIYFTLLRAIHQVRVSEASLRNAQEQQTVARRLYEGQIGQKIDFLRANTQVATAQENLTAARNNRDIARASFNDLVGRPLTAPVVIQDVPGVNVGVDIPTAAANAASGVGPTTVGAPPGGGDIFVPYPAPIAEVGAINIDQSVTSAQAARPEILQQAALVRASDVGVRVSRSGLEPTFSISASGNYYPTPSFQYPRQRTAALTVAVSIPLYDGGLTRDRIAEAKERTKNARTALDSTKEDVALQVRQDYLSLATAARQIDAANTALQQAIAARQLAQVRYEGQVGIYLEVTDAQSALVQAENSQVDAVYNYLIARAQFENALGAPRIAPAPATVVAAPAAPTTTTPAPTTPPTTPTPTVPAPTQP